MSVPTLGSISPESLSAQQHQHQHLLSSKQHGGTISDYKRHDKAILSSDRGVTVDDSGRVEQGKAYMWMSAQAALTLIAV